MRVDLRTIPELPAEGADCELRPRRRRDIALAGKTVTLGWRERGQGPAVVLLPGPFSVPFAFRAVFGALPESLRVLLLETVPLIDAAATPGRPVEIPDLAEALRRALDGVQVTRPLLVAEGALGLVAVRWALDRPDALLGLVLIGCSFAAGRPERFWQRLRSSESAQARAARRISRRPLAQALSDLDYADPALLSRLELRRLAEPLSTVPGAMAHLQRLAAWKRADFASDLLRELRSRSGQSFPVPLKLLFGDRDAPAVRGAGEELTRLFPGTEMFVAESSGRAVHAEKPEWTARIVARCAGSSP